MFSRSRIHFSTRLSFLDGWGVCDQNVAEKSLATISYLRRIVGNKIPIEFEHCKLGCVEDLVAKLPVTLDAEDLKINVATYELILKNLPPSRYAYTHLQKSMRRARTSMHHFHILEYPEGNPSFVRF